MLATRDWYLILKIEHPVIVDFFFLNLLLVLSSGLEKCIFGNVTFFFFLSGFSWRYETSKKTKIS